jgi:hypothetical protein
MLVVPSKTTTPGNLRRLHQVRFTRLQDAYAPLVLCFQDL